MENGGVLKALSALFGWVYTFCWSLSFYPQPLLNYRRKSTSGTTVDFPFVNVLGIEFCSHTVHSR
jgi:cystinosin